MCAPASSRCEEYGHKFWPLTQPLHNIHLHLFYPSPLLVVQNGAEAPVRVNMLVCVVSAPVTLPMYVSYVSAQRHHLEGLLPD